MVAGLSVSALAACAGPIESAPAAPAQEQRAALDQRRNASSEDGAREVPIGRRYERAAQVADRRMWMPHTAQRLDFDWPIAWRDHVATVQRPSEGPTRALDGAAVDNSMVASAVTAITGARIVRDAAGAALTARIAALPAERRAQGISALTMDEVYGTSTARGLCEDVRVEFTVTEGGAQWEHRYNAAFLSLMEPLQPALYALSAACVTALSTAGATVSAAVGAGCSAQDEAAHFPAGSRCRACLEVDGDHARCVAASQCRAQMTREVLVDGRSYDVLEARMLACAPDYTTTVIALANELGEDNARPRAFDHGVIYGWCYAFTDPGQSAPTPHCITSPMGGPRVAYSDVVMDRVEFIRRAGTTTNVAKDRVWIANRIELEGGMTLEESFLHPQTIATLSEPFAQRGWNLMPNALRPDGRDPARLEDTFALDWIAGLVLKTATSINGVPVMAYNHNLCTSWSAPAADGHSSCQIPIFTDSNQPPNDDVWRNDWAAYAYSTRPLRVEILPIVTLAATGRADASISGGHVPLVLGSTTLADPDWDNCRWPQTFVPDEMANYETLDFPGEYMFNTQTWRFGRDPATPVRLALATSWRRAFCFDGQRR
ncbi:MAG: hypothetical protein U0269_27680 [Polyangiales bacterium]